MFAFLARLLPLLALATGPGPIRGFGAGYLLKPGMTEENVDRMLKGGLIFGDIANSRWHASQYPDDHLRVFFIENGNRATLAYFYIYRKTPTGLVMEPVWWFLPACGPRLPAELERLPHPWWP